MPTQTMTRADEQPGETAPLVLLRTQLEQRAEEFRFALPSHIRPEKFQRTLLTAVQLNPELLACDRRSFLNSCMKAAQDGLLPDGREAAIVPFKSRQKDAQGRWGEVRLAQYMPMVFGVRKKILQSGEVTDIRCQVVYRQEIEAGRFIYEDGTNQEVRYRPNLDPDFKPVDADIALVFSVATFAGGGQSFEFMRRYEIDRVREASQTGATLDRNGQPREAKGPWVEWFPEMAKKTCLRRHAKSLPQSGDIILTDVEADDMTLASRSAAAMLASREPDAPRPLIEDGDPGHDPVTGEVPPPPEPDPAPELEPQGSPFVEEPPQAEDLGPDQAEEPPQAEDEVEPEPEPEPEKDELGITKSAEEKRAEDYITRARKTETIVDLRKLEKEIELDVAAMRPDVAACVDTEIENAHRRLKPAPRQPKAFPQDD